MSYSAFFLPSLSRPSATSRLLAASTAAGKASAKGSAGAYPSLSTAFDTSNHLLMSSILTEKGLIDSGLAPTACRSADTSAHAYATGYITAAER